MSQPLPFRASQLGLVGMSSTTFQSRVLGNKQATVSSKPASMNFAAVVAPLQPGRIVSKACNGYVLHQSTSKKRQPSHQRANSRVEKLSFLPCSRKWSCSTCSWNCVTKSRSSDAAARPLPFAAATKTKCAQAAWLNTFPWPDYLHEATFAVRIDRVECCECAQIRARTRSDVRACRAKKLWSFCNGEN